MLYNIYIYINVLCLYICIYKFWFMVSVIINDLEFLVKANVSILEACKYVGVYIPRFCYHETLSVAGNCRMCLVEVNELEKPVASCVTLVQDGMIINTDTMFVKKARENVIEALLINHPLDCPICDQAGECDLQDQTKLFGSDHSRFFFNKRGVEDKNCGPLIKTIMTRCIHCTRCVRYSTEIAGQNYLGTLNRGTSTEIGAYISKMFASEISGNVIDLCPVGALTSKPYAFKARPWELRINESIDLTDGLGSNIYVSFKEAEISRITPKSNSSLNDNIISDKARFSYDFQTSNRIKAIYLKKNLIFTKSVWVNIFESLDVEMKSGVSKILIVVNSELDLESLCILKTLENMYSNKVSVCISNSQNLSQENFFVYNKKRNVNNLKSESDSCFFFSVNPKIECAIINAKLRMKYKRDLFNNYAFGSVFDNGNMPITFLNLTSFNICKFVEGKFNSLSRIFLNSQNPLVLIGETINPRIFAKLAKLNCSVKIISIFNTSNAFGAKMLNIKPLNKNDLTVNDNLMVLNEDDNFKNRRYLKLTDFKKTFWANTHGSSSALKYNYILPTTTGFEDEEIHINLEGRCQKTESIFRNSTDARSVKKVLKVIFNSNIKKLELTEQNNFKHIEEMLKKPYIFDSFKHVFIDDSMNLSSLKYVSKISNYPIKSNKEDFYFSNKMSKNSLIMSNCSSSSRRESNNFLI